VKLFLCAGEGYRAKEASIGRAVELLSMAGCTVTASSELSDEFPGCGIAFLEREKAEQECDSFLSVGGDGTLLFNAQSAFRMEKPILGANAGTLGFLCAFDLKKPAEITEEAVEKLRISERMVYEAKCSLTGDKVYYAMNEVVIMRGPVSKTIELQLFKNDRPLTRYRSDGVIVSTPSGSTAYSFSAGGPVIEPGLDLSLITPICAHSSLNRSIIISGNDRITMLLTGRNGNDAYFSADSFENVHLVPGSKVEVVRDSRRLKLYTSDYEKYLEALNNKFSESV
jgi:NAD+ kinase